MMPVEHNAALAKAEAEIADTRAALEQKPRLSFDDPKPVLERRRMQTIFLRPDIKAQIDARRGTLSRSAWIENALLTALKKQP